MSKTAFWSQAEIDGLKLLVDAKASLSRAAQVLAPRSRVAVAVNARERFGYREWYNQMQRERDRGIEDGTALEASYTSTAERVEFKVVAVWDRPVGERREITFCRDRADYDAACVEAKASTIGRLKSLVVESVGRGVGGPYVMERLSA